MRTPGLHQYLAKTKDEFGLEFPYRRLITTSDELDMDALDKGVVKYKESNIYVDQIFGHDAPTLAELKIKVADEYRHEIEKGKT